MAHAARIILDDSDFLRHIASLKKTMPLRLGEGLVQAMDIVGAVAVGAHMVRGADPTDFESQARVPGDKLNIRTSRLSRSILNEESEWGREGIRKIIIKPDGSVDAIIGSKTPYAAIHEFGGDTGRFIMPSRPYLRPAVKESNQEILKILDMKIQLAIEESDAI